MCRTITRVIATVFPVLCFVLISSACPRVVWSQGHGHGGGGHSEEGEGHSHDKAQGHGGQVTMSNEKEFHFEVVFHHDAVQVYLYDGEQNPISAKDVTGTVTLSFRDPHRKRLSADLLYAEPAEEKEDKHGDHHEEEEEHQQDLLQAKIDLAKVPEGNAKALFAMKNLPGKKEKEITFKETFKLGRFTEYVCPMKDSEPADHPGKCKKCGMELEQVAFIYRCPMHAKVTSRDKADKCWICGMKLSKAEDHQEREHDEKTEGHGTREHGH